MWWGSEPDPENSGGEGSKEPPQSQQLMELQEQFEQQQTFIAQLKEMLRKTEQSSSVSREKVEEYASTLNEINARAKLSKKRRSEGRKNDPEASSSKSISTSSKKSTVVTPAKEKINLLRQQLEENRVKIAERDKSQKDVEVMVNQLRAQLDESQATINDPIVNIPKTETEIVTTPFSPESSKDDLLFAIKSKDDHIIELTAKVQNLQANVLDLQENIKEKDSVIDARTKAITLLSESLSKKGKDTLDMLDETKEQMRNMQQNFVAMEAEMKEKNAKLQSELVIKENRIQELTEINCILENNNLKLNVASSGKEKEIVDLNKTIEELQSKIREVEEPSLEKNEEKESSSSGKSSKRKGSKKSKSKDTIEPKVESADESVHLARIAELEKMVEELLLNQEESTNVDEGEDLSTHKFVAESNKQRIKMRAQYKAKVKELRNKEAARNIIGKAKNVESENVRLCQRVAELEEEKGNLQLKLVDYEANKEKEYIADLENKIEEQKMEIENHIRTITTLETQITTSSNELSALRNELANMMHIENAQVCSEMTSVQLEEQLDKEVSQKKEIQDKYNEIIKENESLLEKIEVLNKEKQDLSAKLDQYMQENIDLIDRLEKLSAEKVSSAESIEIVDALTHQEKLEIEAYQKNLDFISDSDKHIDEQNQDINESVSKLNEETSELMEKIKLFTDERREVMEKMDNLDKKYQELSGEKNALVSKVDELLSENEGLKEKLSENKIQEELIEYRAIIENQKLQIASLQEDLWNKSDNEAEKASENKLKELNNSLNSQLRTLQAEFESLYNENETVNKELNNARNKITELENIRAENTSLRDDLQKQVENCDKLIAENKRLVANEAKLDILENETYQLNQTIQQLNVELEMKEKSNSDTVASLSNQLAELKTIISENFEQLQQYEEEMNKNSENTEELKEKLEELNYKMVETEHIIELKNIEINSLKQDKTALETKIKNLEDELREKKDNFTEICRELKEKCKFLENQIETNSGSLDDIKGPLEAKIVELEQKNKLQVEKMKKIAANLKKKSNMCQELETRLSEFKEKWENESKEKDEKQKMIDEQQNQLIEEQKKIEELQNLVEEIRNEKNTKSSELTALLDRIKSQEKKEEMMKETIQEKTEEIQRLNLKIDQIESESKLGNKQIVQNLEDQLKSMKTNHQNLEDQLESMKNNHETLQNAMDAKLQEKDLFIENLEAENAKFRERIDKLEEGLSNIEERRQLLEEKAFNLKIQLEEKSSVCDEASQSENLLERRLSALLAHDEMIEQKLEQSMTENQILAKKNKILTEENGCLQSKIEEINSKLEESSQDNTKVELLENEVSKLKTIISSLENEAKRLQLEHEKAINEMNSETESMEAELNSLQSEKKYLLNQCEILQDNAKEYADNYQMLTEEMDELRENLFKTKQQLDEVISENQQLVQNNENNLAKIIDFGNNSSVSGDVNLLKTEIEKLQNVISQKDVEIQNYQRQNMQLQMSSFGAPSAASFFNEPQLAEPQNKPQFAEPQYKPQSAEPQIDHKEIQILQQEITELNKQISTYDKDLSCAKDQIEELEKKCASAQNDLQENEAKILDLQEKLMKQQELKSIYEISQNEPHFEDQKETHILQEEITKLNKQISVYDKELLCAKDKIEELEKKYISAQIDVQENEAKILDLQEKLIEQQELKRVYEISQNDLEEKNIRINNLQKELSNLQEELSKQQELIIRKTAEQGVEEIISSAEKSLSENTADIVPIFEEFFQKQESHVTSNKPPLEITKEELLRKIKALEFMLFNIEKEKDDTLIQCHEFTNELARLIYEREKLVRNKPSKPDKPEPDMTTLEKQILSMTEVDNATKDLNLLEFPPVDVKISKEFFESTPTPVAEEVIQLHKAYLCYTEDKKSPTKEETSEEVKIHESIASQIVYETKITPEDQKQFELLRFGQVMPENMQDPSIPVRDCVPDPKQAYICYPEAQKSPSKEETKIQESVASQIVHETKITPEDKKQFEFLRFGQLMPKNTQDASIPVSDCVPDPKQAYICYPEAQKSPSKEETKIQESVASQIVHETKITPEDKKQFEFLRFGQLMPKNTQDPSIPVSDCVPDPKQAYICHPEGRNVLAEDTFASEEDGWGWNAEEAKLEAEHRMTLGASAPEVDRRVEQLQERIHDLEVERSRLLEEIKSSQVRSGKLIKKLKLMKEKNDNLEAEAKKNTFGDLELTIQDELNSQVHNLEKKIKELVEENSKDKIERENLLKKLEVITNANDRMIEMKEKQDNEIQFLNFKNRELSAKLEQLEWGDDSPNKTPSTSQSSEINIDEQRKHNEEFIKKIAELNSIINDLTLDNEEMQCMLEEQRNLRLEAEKALSNRPIPENMKSEQEFLKVETENRNLNDELSKLNDVQQALEDRFAKSERTNKNLLEEIKQLNDLKLSLEEKITYYVKSNDELSDKCTQYQTNIENLIKENQLINNQYSTRLLQIENENIALQNQLMNINTEKETLLQNQIDPLYVSQLQNEKLQLHNQITNLNIEKEGFLKNQINASQSDMQLQNQIANLSIEKETLKNEVEISHAEMNRLKSEISRLEEDNRRLENLLLEKENNLQNLNLKIQQIELEKSSVETRLQEILNIQNADKTNDEKLQQMNEQLATALTNLDNKNKEIVELNTILSKERSEFDQKLTVTVEQLAQQWSERVDERGNNVAESWKLHLDSVQNEFTQKEENLRAELNNIFKQNEELLSQNSDLQKQLQSVLEEKSAFVSDNNTTIESLQQNLNNKQVEVNELLENVRNKEEEILKLSRNMSELSQINQNKDSEILELYQNVKNKEAEILELSQKLEESSSELQLKNSEIINLQLTFEEMQSKEIDYQNYVQQYAQQLEERTSQCNHLQEKLNELNSFSQEEEKEISDLKNMIENQVLKIENLKREMEQKDADYNALVEEFEKMEASFLRPQAEKLESSKKSPSENIDSQPDSANRAELDLALYMLHQRDVRCEELTVELMQLLEERDTLQLKLSNAIRVNEELKVKTNEKVEDQKDSPKSVKSTGAIPKSKSSAIVLGATGTELATEATEGGNMDASATQDFDELTNKLSQLHTVGYNRDKTLKDDQQIRHIQQMSLMQEHRDLAAKLPAEAAARLVDASYTVSRDVQSPSKVLLNWLWGRSTPKVNDV